MYFDNAIAIHRQRIAATKAHDNYLADRLTEKLDWAVRCHVKEIGGTERKDYLNVYLSVASIALGYDKNDPLYVASV